MPNYLFLLHLDPSVLERASPEEMQEIIQKYATWRQRLQAAGVIVGGDKLQDGTGRVLRRNAGQTSIIDGPYTESKEVIAGIFKILAPDYQAAVEVATECPHLEYGTLEIREVQPVPGLPSGEGASQ